MIKFSNNVRVNLRNVSSIKIDSLKSRLILNMNYPIEKHGNILPDYIYVDNFTNGDINAIKACPDFKNFIMGSPTIWVNKNEIASIRVDGDEVIVNMAVPHTYRLRGNQDNWDAVMANYLSFGIEFLDLLGE